MITVDASVHVNALNPTEAGSAESKAFLEWLQQAGHPVYGAVAQYAGSILVTADRQQLEHLREAITVMSPAEALEQLPDPQPSSAEAALKALRGRGRGERLVDRLLEERRKDRDREA